MEKLVKAWKYGSNVDTGEIIDAKYTKITEVSEQAKHAFEGIDPEFTTKVSPGDVIVAAENFGCGSSREAAPVVLKAAGIQAIFAESFGRIFYRNAINIGLTLIECDKSVSKSISDGESVSVDLEAGTITTANGYVGKGRPLPQFMINIIKAGGMVEYKKKQLKDRM